MITADDYLNYVLEEVSKEKELEILAEMKRSYNAKLFVKGLRKLVDNYDGNKGKIYKELKMNPDTIMKF